MKKQLVSTISLLIAAIASSNALAGGGGQSWTHCYVNDSDLQYSFRGYTRWLSVGDTIRVWTKSPEDKSYGRYQIDTIDLSKDIGLVTLSFLPSGEAGAGVDTDFGQMKIEFFSDSSLKDIKVTFSKGTAASTAEQVTCWAD